MDIKKILYDQKHLWDLYSSKEEYENKKIDKHGRFLFRYSKKDNVENPFVSSYINKKGFYRPFPNNKKFAVFLSHDIDSIFPTFKNRCFTGMKIFFKQLNIRKSLDRLTKKDNPYFNFKDIINLEEKYNAKSTFFFLSTKKDIDFNLYDVRYLKNEIKDIIESGFEVGLHGGYYSYNNLSDLKKEKEILEQITSKKITGYRSHYLRFNIPNTWKTLLKVGFRYDSTFGYPDRVGFRNGMCHPFKPYDLNNDSEIDILEIPLHIMDRTLFSQMNLNEKEAWAHSKKIIDTVEQNNGVLTLLWHNYSFDTYYYKGWAKLYEKILEYCYKKNAWLTSGENILDWYNKSIKNS